VRLARLSDAGVAAQVLATAFTGYPWMAWTVDPRDHTARLRGLYLATLQHLVVPYGAAWVAEQRTTAGTELVGAAGWLTPASNPPAPVWEKIAEIEQQLRGERWEHHSRAEAELACLRSPKPHWLLGAIGILPQHQGRGVARRLLRPGLQQAEAEGFAVCLETSSPANVAMYQRLGFTVTGTVTIDGGGPRVWAMQRPTGPG
jgi:ribosomal protein S18 acetylase RimI-like enzyme